MPRPVELPSEEELQGKRFEGAGTSPNIYIHRGKFIKQAYERGTPDVEEKVSKAMMATKTPGAIKTVAVKWPEGKKEFAISDHIKGGVPLAEYTGKLPDNAGDILLSEQLMGVRDRHGDNYMVSPKGVHSIDHEYAFGDPDRDSIPSELYRHLQSHGQEPRASEEHLNRWERYADEYRKMMEDNPQHLEHFNRKLQMARQLVDRYGYVPIKHLLSTRHRVVLHGQV